MRPGSDDTALSTFLGQVDDQLGDDLPTDLVAADVGPRVDLALLVLRRRSGARDRRCLNPMIVLGGLELRDHVDAVGRLGQDPTDLRGDIGEVRHIALEQRRVERHQAERRVELNRLRRREAGALDRRVRAPAELAVALVDEATVDHVEVGILRRDRDGEPVVGVELRAEREIASERREHGRDRGVVQFDRDGCLRHPPVPQL